ncbi:MAG: TIGR04282 family arsenosugar biosynthesis glycosyltransferase [Polyangiaceae bacterium]|nr:TIGR04282 family arsenosugar biosynthesis glycosyltransferase [Polyangiaceae bacterium]
MTASRRAGPRRRQVGSGAPAQDTTICLFAKPPVAGIAKTRLAPALGAAGAAELAFALLQDTWAAVAGCAWARGVVATPAPERWDVDLAGRPEVWAQGEGDLGARMERVARRALTESRRVLLVGADSPGIPAGALTDARRRLGAADAVLCPTPDGGFWALGLRRCPEGALAEVEWSAATTLRATEARLQRLELRVDRGVAWLDVDVPADLALAAAAIARGDALAPATRAALERGRARGSPSP